MLAGAYLCDLTINLFEGREPYGPIGLIMYLGVPDKMILKIIFPKVKFNLFVFYGFTQTKKLVGDLKNIYFPYFRHFYDQSVMADTLGIFSFLVIISMKHILNHILMVYLSACMWFHRSNSLKPLNKLMLNLFFNLLDFCTVFCVGHYISWILCWKHINLKERLSIMLRK